jgi:hypothetical protein
MKLLTVGLLSLVARSAEGQTYSGLTSYGGSNYDDGLAVAADSSGNTYVTGTFESNPFKIGGYVTSSTQIYTHGDIFVAKRSETGSVTWVVRYVSLVDLVRVLREFCERWSPSTS